MGHAPEHFRRYNEAYLPLRFDNHLGPRLTEIVRLAVAQTTRCPVCMAGRVPAATEAGLTEDLVAKLATGDRDGFTEAEGVALDYVLKLATDHLSIGDADRAAMRSHFTPTQIVRDQPARRDVPGRPVLDAVRAGRVTWVTRRGSVQF